MKNSSPTMCSGSVPAAHRPTVNTTSAAACMVLSETPAGGGVKYRTTDAATTVAVSSVDDFTGYLNLAASASVPRTSMPVSAPTATNR
jgi:hypothetical protein